MSDLRRQLDATRRRCERLEAENADLRHYCGDVDPSYARAYALLCDIAHLGIRRGAAHIASAPDSRPPSYHAAAYSERNEQRREQRRLAAGIHRTLSRLMRDLGDTPGGAELEHPNGPGPGRTDNRSVSA